MISELSLFVYGSFCPNQVHYQRLQEYVIQQQPVSVKGTAYRLQVGYPIFSIEGNDKIQGYLLKLQAPQVLFTILDEFHGVSRTVPEKSLFFKENISVECEDGSSQNAFVYSINLKKLPKTAQIIAKGAWQQSLQQQPAFTNSLTERQKTYVQKLGQSTGREIVPIDLGLYRELMKLEVIVDKGRRLALSRLGKEVYRYLS